MPVISIRHVTTYRYRKPVAFGEHRMMLRPLAAADQRVISQELTISPEPSLLRHVQDVSGADLGVARFETKSDRLVFDSHVRLHHEPGCPLDLEADDSWLHAGDFAYALDEQVELSRSVRRPHADPQVDAWARTFVRPAGRTRVSDALRAMNAAIHAGFSYALRISGGPQSPGLTLATRRGSCRDFAVLMMDAARSLGLAARFVSGYVYTGSAKARTGGGHTHAWVRVYVPGCGWTDFDPTNGIVGNADLVRVAVVADPVHALPLHGSWSGDACDFISMDVDVALEVETPAVTQPAHHLRVAHRR